MKIGICGICGRMGLAILDVVLEKGHTLTAAFDAPENPNIGKDVSQICSKCPSGIKVETINSSTLSECDCIIDFSNHKATMELLQILIDNKDNKNNKTSLVIGTTGFSEDQKDKIRKAAESIPIVWSPSMSVGVNILFKITEIASKALNDNYNVEIFEAHHKFKKDAPSGTANMLFDIVRKSMPNMADAKPVYGREGFTGERSQKEIGMMAMRASDIVGEHTVFMAGPGERLELTARSTSRATYAAGSVLAAEFLFGKQPKLYSMFDVLGL
jgi:4-hydroxy-tetrahydrodipicolinate reductase